MASYERAIVCTALGLASQAGLVAEIVKKHLYHEHPLPDGELRMRVALVRQACQRIEDILWEITEESHA